MQDFVNASDCYEQLSIMHPEVEEYKLHYAQALYKACLYQEAMKVACQIDNPEKQADVGAFIYTSILMQQSFVTTAPPQPHRARERSGIADEMSKLQGTKAMVLPKELSPCRSGH